MPVTTICLFSSNFLLILKCYNNVFPVCHIFKHTLDYFLCILVGYIADFICYVANDVVQIQMNLPLRILALLLAQLMAYLWEWHYIWSQIWESLHMTVSQL